jgi:hypothetical protein
MSMNELWHENNIWGPLPTRARSRYTKRRRVAALQIHFIRPLRQTITAQACLMAWVMLLMPVWGEETAIPSASQSEEKRTVSNALPRDPFWPVGYTPPKPKSSDAPMMVVEEPENIATEEDWKQAQKRLVASSVFRTKDPVTGADRVVALIDRKVVAPGEILTVKHRDFTFRFKVSSITSDGPQFERVVEN